jgi:hypothetical protein
MTGNELEGLLHGAERSAGWLAAKLVKADGAALSRTHVVRWMRGERDIPDRYVERIRELLTPVAR